MSGPWVQVKLLSPWAIIPEYAHEEDLGADVFSSADVCIRSGEVWRIPLGFAAAFSPNYYATLNDRSSMADAGIFVVGGYIDPNYRGEWQCMLYNSTPERYLVERGQKIAQAIWHRRNKAVFIPATELSETDRGTGGFGSTDNPDQFRERFRR